MYKYLIATVVGLSSLLLSFVLGTWYRDNPPQPIQETTLTEVSPREIQPLTASVTNASRPVKQSYEVIKVIDGDTLDVSINGQVERIRLIGINTPETVDPRKPVECFGIEASNKAKSILTGEKVVLESDSSQGERDKYNRLLRYVFLEDGTNLNLLMVQDGYAYEYTYDGPYKYQADFKQSQKEAEENNLGLWSSSCLNQAYTTEPLTSTDGIPGQPAQTGSCNIKGNINSKKDKIYHVLGCGSYDKTVIDESSGEIWFCSEQDAIDAGWRKALNC